MRGFGAWDVGRGEEARREVGSRVVQGRVVVAAHHDAPVLLFFDLESNAATPQAEDHLGRIAVRNAEPSFERVAIAEKDRVGRQSEGACAFARAPCSRVAFEQA